MPIRGIDRLFWAIGLLGHILLLLILLVRHRARHFPWFTTLIACSVLRTLVLYLALRDGSPHTYFYVYWWSAVVVDVVVELGVLYEVAFKVFRPLGRWAPDIRRGMLWVVCGSVALASLLTWMATPVVDHWQETVAIKGSFFFSALMGELVVGMVMLSVTAGLPWRTHAARIAHGLGAYSLMDVAIEAGHTLYGASYEMHVDAVLSYARMLLYLGCLGYWVVTLWQEAPQPREMSQQIREQLRSLQTRVAYDLTNLRSGRKP